MARNLYIAPFKTNLKILEAERYVLRANNANKFDKIENYVTQTNKII